MPKPRMMYYTDARHPLVYMYEPPMRKEEFESTIDELVGTPIEAVMFCLGDGRTVMHDSSAGELWGHNVEKWDHVIFRRAHQNIKSLIEEDNDPLRIICDRAHAKDMLLYPTLLAQLPSGVRGGPGYDIRSSDFRLDNPQLEIGASENISPSYPGLHCADFKHQEVRDERFGIINEVLNNYPVDGFELQLNFWPYYFHPQEIDEGTKTMTNWMEDIYHSVKQGHPDREFVVTIPANMDVCLSRGLDIREWIRRGIVDVLVGQPLQRPELMDPNGAFLTYDAETLANLRSLVKATSNTDCRVHATVNNSIDSDRLSNAPIEMIRAAAGNFWEQGIDGMYVNWFGSWPYQSEFYESLRELPHPDIMAPKDKHYHVPTAMGIDPEGKLAKQLPADLVVGSHVPIDLTINDDLLLWDDAARVHEVILRFRITSATELDEFGFKLNGMDLPSNLMRKINSMYAMSSPRYRVFGQWFIFRLDKTHWPVKGSNALEISILSRDPVTTPTPSLRDVELETKYLLGKSFHRDFIDADLGPYESRTR